MKPEYVFQPAQAIRRLRRAFADAPASAVVRVPWGHRLSVNPREDIGAALWYLGVYDLPVTEVLWRLIEPGATVCDLGANIGYMSSLMAARAGSSGEVVAFEAHPGVFQHLQGNLARFDRAARVTPVQKAVSDRTGRLTLVVPEDFAGNQGRAFLGDGAGLPVEAVTLDDFFAGRPAPSLFKVDVEGAEAQAFRGGMRTLASPTCRHVVFEEHAAWPAPAAQVLMDLGFECLAIGRTFVGPTLDAPDNPVNVPSWLPTNYLATKDASVARDLCTRAGWHSLRG